MRDAQAADYIAFAAKMGTATAPLPPANVGRTGSFMKSHAEMVVAWREFGMGNEDIAAQLTRVGFPISAARVKDLLPSLAAFADRTLVEAIVAQLRVVFRASRLDLARKADAAYVPTLELGPPAAPSSGPSAASTARTRPATAPRDSVAGQPAAGLAHAPVDALPAKPAPSLEQAALPFGPGAEMDASVGKTSVSRARRPDAPAAATKPTSPFASERVAELVSLPGEDDDMSGALTDGVMVSFGDLRRAAWADYTSSSRRHSIALPGGTELNPPKKLFAPLVRGDYRNWDEFIAAVERS